jgi:hypothetical protein
VLHVCSFTHFLNKAFTWASNICHAALQGARGEAVMEMLHSAAYTVFLNFSCMLLQTADCSCCYTSACCVTVQVTHLASTDNDGEQKYVQQELYGKSIVMENGVVSSI